MAELVRTLPLNQVLNINTALVERLWSEGSEPPDEIDFHRDNAAISKDGRWLIRRLELDELELSVTKNADQICLAAIAELGRLRQCGLSAISHGFVTNHDASSVFTVSTYIPNLVECTNDDFCKYVAPSLSSYLSDQQKDDRHDNSRLYFDDIYTSRQYAKLKQAGLPLLLDVDPIMHASGPWVGQLGAVMGSIVTSDLYLEN